MTTSLVILWVNLKLCETALELKKQGEEGVVVSRSETCFIRTTALRNISKNWGELGKTYPEPYVDVKESAEAALEAYHKTGSK